MIGRGTGLTVRGGKISSGLREDPEEKKKLDLRKDPPGKKEEPPTETDPKPTPVQLAIAQEKDTFKQALSENDRWFLNPQGDRYKKEYKNLSKDQIDANIENKIYNLHTYAKVNAIQNPEATSFIKRLMDNPNWNGEDLSVDPDANDGLSGDKARLISPFELGQSKDFYKQLIQRDGEYKTFSELRDTEIPKDLRQAREKDPKGLYVEGGIKVTLPQHKGKDYVWPGSGVVYMGATIRPSEFKGPGKYAFVGLTQEDFPITKIGEIKDVNRDPITGVPYGFSDKYQGYYTVSQAEVDAFNAQVFAQLKMKNEFDNEKYIASFGTGGDEILDPDGQLLLSSEQKQRVFAARNEAIRNR